MQELDGLFDLPERFFKPSGIAEEVGVAPRDFGLERRVRETGMSLCADQQGLFQPIHSFEGLQACQSRDVSVSKRDCLVDLVKRFGTLFFGRVLPAAPDPRQDCLKVGLPVRRRVGKVFESVDGAPVMLGRLPTSRAALGFRRQPEAGNSGPLPRHSHIRSDAPAMRDRRSSDCAKRTGNALVQFSSSYHEAGCYRPHPEEARA